MTARVLSAQDALWLTMDRPNNLMVIDGILMLRGVPDWDTLLSVARERVLERFPVFTCRPIAQGRDWAWEPDPDFDIARHVQRATLPAPGEIAQLEDYVASRRSRPMDRAHPLWDVTLVDGLTLADGTPGSALVSRFHHAVADGVRLTMVMLSLCDEEDAQISARVARESTPIGPADVIGGLLSATAAIVADSVRLTGKVAAEVLRDGTRAIERGAALGSDLVRHPDRLADALDLAGVESRVTNDISTVAKLLLRGPSVETVWSGTPSTDKAIVWSPPLPLDAVKAAGRAHGATVNDVLITAVGGGLRRYLEARGDRGVDEVAWMVPVNLVPLDDNLPEDLGNFFALVMIVLPLTPADPVERLAATQRRMNHIKHSDEPVLTFGIQRGISAAPAPVAVGLTDFFANKAVGVLTNVPGPRTPITFAGVEVDQVIGFAPCSGDQPMTATIFSYADTVTMGFAVDAVLVPEPRELLEATLAELDALVGMHRG